VSRAHRDWIRDRCGNPRRRFGLTCALFGSDYRDENPGFPGRADDVLLGSCCFGGHRVTVVMGRWETEMSFVVAAPEQVQAATHDLAGIRSLLAGSSASAAAPTTAVAAAAQDEVSAGVAGRRGVAGA